MSVNAYFTPAAAPAANQAPVPTPVAPTTAPGAAAGTVFKMDNYAGLAQSGMKIVDRAAPFLPGMIAGIKAHVGAAEAKGHFLRAARAHQSAARAKTPGGSARAMATKASAASSGNSAFFSGVTSAVKSSVLFGGAVSLLVNGYKIFQKKETMADGGAAVTGDLASSVVSGTVAAVASTGVTMALGATALAGFPLTLIGAGVGIVGYFVADKFLRQTAIFQRLTGAVHKLLGGS